MVSKLFENEPHKRVTEYCVELADVGVQARIVDDDASSYLKYSSGWGRLFRWQSRFGVIQLDHERIKYAAIVEDLKHRPNLTWADYIVPDLRLTKRFEKFHLGVGAERNFWTNGRKYGKWSGDDLGTGLLERFSNDPDWRKETAEWQPVRIDAYPDVNAWVIRVPALERRPLTYARFDAYQRLAEPLLEAFIY